MCVYFRNNNRFRSSRRFASQDDVTYVIAGPQGRGNLYIMTKIIYIVSILAALLFSSCDKPEPDSVDKNVLTGYKELLEAYDAGKYFKEVQAGASSNVVVFEDGSKITVPISSFLIHDHTNTSVPAIEVMPGVLWWSIGGQTTSIKALSSTIANENAEPVYVYYDSSTLYMHLSNRRVLKFPSKALEQEADMARRQNIPVIYIDTKGAGIYDKENYVDGTITIKDPHKLYSDVAEFSAAMGIRGRGNSTWSFPKKPYKVKLKEKASIFGMGADKEWALLANYSDRTLMRNILAMKLSEICGFAWTPHMYSVHVYLNNKYQGVYTLCEHKKVHKDRVDIDLDTGDVYLEIEQQQDETTCWWTGMGVPMMFSEPEEPSEELLAEVKKWFSDFEAALYSDYLADPEKGYAAYIDVDSFIDYYIVQELAKNTDGNLRKSSFITKKKGGKLVMCHLWDFDLTFGNGGGLLHDPEGFFIKDFNPGWQIGDNWFNRMMKDPAFVDRLQARWNELYPQFQSMVDFINEQAFVLDKAQQDNFSVWSIWESVDWVDCPSLGSYEAEVEFLKDFYTRRLDWMSRELNRL